MVEEVRVEAKAVAVMVVVMVGGEMVAVMAEEAMAEAAMVVVEMEEEGMEAVAMVVAVMEVEGLEVVMEENLAWGAERAVAGWAVERTVVTRVEVTAEVVIKGVVETSLQVAWAAEEAWAAAAAVAKVERVGKVKADRVRAAVGSEALEEVGAVARVV
jgi:hypothetical protein